MAKKKYYVFWFDEDRAVEIRHGTWDVLKHISRSGVKGVPTEWHARQVANAKQLEYAAVTGTGYMKNLVQHVEEEEE
ncbi:MAG: hypothetical protein KAR06_05875 [Deltaproteobacteria bacterium]|nr:hypothetical protein [Deltaproteobacteria bacterium]